MVKLPTGIRLAPTLEDVQMIDYLCKDDLFIQSIEETTGKLVRIYPDWKNDSLVYELISGEFKHSILSKIIEKLHEIDYMKEFEN